MVQKQGRRSKRTPKLIDELIGVIEAGGSDIDAYSSVGISKDTFYQWMKSPDFSDQVTRARSVGKVKRIKRIERHGENDWRADAWYLERRYPDEYAQHLIIKVTPEQNAILKKAGIEKETAFAQFVSMIEQAYLAHQSDEPKS